MRVLLVSTYELGHQPLHVASPAAALRRAGHEVTCLDLSVELWTGASLAEADAVAFSVPMHTAMRLAMRAATVVRQQRPEVPVCFYGLYAPVSRQLTAGGLADRAIAGEYEPALVAWVGGLSDGGRPDPGGPHAAVQPGGREAAVQPGGREAAVQPGGREAAVQPSGREAAVQPGGREAAVELGRQKFALPARDGLPPLERYAHLSVAGEERLVGYVEASHGCAHRCRHCPVPVVYDGRTRVVGVDVVVEDVAQLVGMGARHITFGDPDFLNGVHHSRRVVEAVHDRFPELTFDCTVKVEHVLNHRDLWGHWAASGCLFVVSALECVNDEILARLDKGHTTAQGAEAVRLLRSHGIEMRPSFLPFTPWTTFDDLLDLLDFVAVNDLIGNVDPVQYTIRLLLPQGSLLLDHPDIQGHLGAYDAERLTWTWTSADPRLDVLQRDLAGLVERATAAGDSPEAVFLDVNAAVRAAAGTARSQPVTSRSVEVRPRLTEPWFC